LSGRLYLDWNATAPLLAPARAAMLAAMDCAGNPSSVHAEGRAARAIVERARAQVAALAGCSPEQVIFTSGATEAAAMTAPRGAETGSPLEHDCLWGRLEGGAVLPVTASGLVEVPRTLDGIAQAAVIAAQNETGAIQPVAAVAAVAAASATRVVCDAVQAAGRVAMPVADYVILSSHKLGGPKGVGALVARVPLPPRPAAGGQEQGRRGGTENVIGIAGFGAAAEAALHAVERGSWAAVARRRDRLEARIATAAQDAIFMAHDVARLPNTSCFAVPGWRGETQVMQLDLAGFAVSAGSACSSGKVRASRALRAMGHDETVAGSAVRVSLGPDTTDEDIDRFCAAWIGLYAKRRARAA
jgi:cysteine desulfurase